jgi:hypothetical protein
MTARQDARTLVTSSFPGHDSLIDRAYRENESFRDLCQDYRNCALALDRWRRQKGDQPSRRAREYAELLAELTGEVESWLGALRTDAGPLGRRGAS